MAPSSRSVLIAARASPRTKASFAALAASRGLNESSLLTLLIETVLEQNPAPIGSEGQGRDECASGRISLRLRPGDRALIDARAAKRGMKPASYLVALIRSHVRRNPPLPTAELHALKTAVAHLSAIERHLVRLSTGRTNDLFDDGEVLRLLHENARRVEDVRRFVADLIRVHLMSWEAGDA